MAPAPLRSRRSQLLASCMMALLAAPAAAQTYSDRALQGDSTVVSGGVTIGRSATADVIQVSTPQAVINWNPETGTAGAPPTAGSPWNFLPAGRTATFQGAATGQDFVVLNRILPASGRSIQFNGTVTSQIRAGIGPTGAPIFVRGGSVWFYSPTGIIAGATSVFNVGNLVLTANDIDTTGGLFSAGGAIRFRGAANSTSAITVQPGAQFNQPATDSYLALVAPQVTMGGTATVNGSAAYVAAEQVDVTINNGLFDMSFITGTGVANALTHTGTTTGPATANGTIAMATMPKNTAITMLVGGTIGYTPAASATVQNGTVVLSAGYNLAFGSPISTVSDGPGGNVTIGNASFTSSVTANATDTLLASPTTPGALTFSGNADLSAENLVSIGADSGETVSVGGTLTLSSTRSRASTTATAGTARLYSTVTTGSPLAAPVVTVGGLATVGATAFGTPGEDGQTANGGTALLDVTGGTMNLTGGLTLNASANGGDGGNAGGNGTGGTARLTIAGGNVTLGNTLTVSANGFGGSAGNVAGNGIGGTASVALNPGAQPTVLNLNGIGHTISAIAGVAGQFQSPNGGNATGGNALLTINSGTMSSIELSINAGATGGDAQAGVAGNASGGTARVLMTGGRYDTSSLFLNADERQAGADAGGTSGSTTGSGLAAVDVTGPGILNVGLAGGNSMSLSANAILSGARFGVPTTGGTLVAGTARLTATAGGTVTTDATAPSAPKPPVLVTASVVYPESDPAQPSATQRAGNVVVIADGGTLSLHKLDARANAIVRSFATAAGAAGPSFGGNVTLAARNGGNLTVRTGSGATPVSAYATGGNTTTPAPGTGGTIDISAQGGTLALPDGLAVDARGFNGNNQGGTGGNITLRALAGTAAQAGSFTAGATTLDASGQINAGLPSGTNGAIVVTNTGQTMTFANLFARAGAANGTASGSITLTADNAPITTTANFTGIDLGTLGTLSLNAVGTAGSIVGSTGVFGYGNDILVGHTGVAPGAASTVTGPSVSLEAGRDQIHTGPVTLRGGTVRVVGRRTLGGADSAIFATSGDIELGSGLNASTNGILFRILDAAGRLRGYQGASSYTNEVTTPATFTVGERVFAGVGDIDIRAGTGIDIADAGTSVTGQVLLSSTTGDVRLATSGIALATRPGGITLGAPGGTARFTNIFSRGAITATGQAVIGGSLNAATNVLLTGQTGVTVPTVISGGTVALNAPAGAVTVATNLQPGGTATATGQSIFLRSLGALTFASLNATAGNLDVGTVGALSVTTPQATGSVLLASSGSNVAFGTATAGTSFTANAAGSATGTSATATAGPLAITGVTGVTVPTLISGGTTMLSAANGAITVATNLQSAGLVTASGRSLLLRSTGALPGGVLTATAGNIDVLSGGALSFATAQATGNLILSAGTTILGGAASATGTANIGNQATGGNVTLASLTTGGNAVVAGNTTTATLSVGTSQVGGFLEARGAALNFGNVTAGTDAILSSYNGALAVGDVTAGDDIFLTVNGSNANPATASPDSQTGVTSATQFALTTGNLSSTGAGSDTALSGPRTFGTAAGPTGNVIRVRASGTVQTGAITTPGTAIVSSDLASLATGAIGAPAGVGLFASGNATTGNVTTNGAFWLGNSTQNFLFVPSYAVSNYGFFQTPTNGGAALGTVQAALIRGSVLTGTTYASMAATGDLLWTSGNATTVGGSFTGGALSAGTSLTARIGGSIGFTTATAGTAAVLTASTGNLQGISVTGQSVDANSQTGLLLTSATSTTGDVNLTTLANELRVGTIVSSANILAAATDGGASSANIVIGTATSGGSTRIFGGTTVPGTVTTGTLTTGGALDVEGAAVALGDIASGGNATLMAVGGALSTGNVAAANLRATADGNLTTGRVTAGEDIRLNVGPAPALIATGDLTAGDDIVATGNAITTGNLVTTGLGPDTDDSGSSIDLQLNRIATGTANSAGTILYAASQPISFVSTASRLDTIIRSFGPITGGNSTAGTTLTVQGGTIDTGNGTAGGALTYINFNAGETIRTGALSGATVSASSQGTLATGAVTASGNIDLFGVSGVTVASAASTGGSIQLNAQGTGPVTSGALRAGGDLNVSANGGAVALTTLDAGGRIVMRAGGGTFTFDRATATGPIGFSATGNIAFGTATSGDSVQAQTPGTLTATSVTSTGTGPSILQGDAGVTVPTVAVNGALLLSAANGALRVGTDLRATGPITARGRSVTLRAVGALGLPDVSATAGAIDVATGGNLTIGTMRASGDIVLTSALDLTVGTALEAGATFAQQPGAANGAATLTARNITVNGSAEAQGLLTATATGTVAINGDRTSGRAGTEISSADIAIGANGVLGRTGSRLVLTNSGTAQTAIGTVAGTGGWRLDAAELSRIRATSIAINAPVVNGPASTAFNSARAPDVLIGGFTLAGGTQLGGEGTFGVTTAGKIRVTGAMLFTGMTRDNTVALRGDEAVEILDAGSIVLNGTNGLDGTLDLTSRNIVASSSAALADFTAATTLTAISDRAGRNDGPVNDAGYLQAGAIRATLLNSTLIIQNTGAATTAGNRDYDGRRGFTVGAGGFTIVQGGNNPMRIAINGRALGATTPSGRPTVGGFVTGLDATQLIRFQPFTATGQATTFTVGANGVPAAQVAATFDPVSTSNGCAIVSTAACRVATDDPIRDILAEDFGEDALANLLPLSIIQLKDYVTPGEDPLIDEPVTGAGNDDLWTVDDGTTKCDPAKESCPR